jgi:hypothetical protein
VNNIRCEASDALQNYTGQKDHVIGLTFVFTTEIHKNLSGMATLGWPVLLGKFKIGFDGGLNKTRRGDENLTVAETFREMQGLQCDRIRSLRALAYPIVGTIGMAGVIDKYLALQSLPHARMSDYYRTLYFTLSKGAGVHPQWALVRATGTTLDANIDATVDRSDFHQVKIAISPVPRELTAAEKIAERTYYVRILEGRAPGIQRFGEPPPAGGAIVVPRGPSAVESAKERVIRDLRDDRRLDTYREIERRLGPPR